MGATARAASGSADGLPVVVGDKGPGDGAGCGGPLGHRGGARASCTWQISDLIRIPSSFFFILFGK